MSLRDTPTCSSTLKVHNVLPLFHSRSNKTQFTVQQQGKALYTFIKCLPADLIAWNLVIIFCDVLEVDSFLYLTQLRSAVESIEFKREAVSRYLITLKILLINSTLSRTATSMFCSNHQCNSYWLKCKSAFSHKECSCLLLQQQFFLKTPNCTNPQTVSVPLAVNNFIKAANACRASGNKLQKPYIKSPCFTYKAFYLNEWNSWINSKKTVRFLEHSLWHTLLAFLGKQSLHPKNFSAIEFMFACLFLLFAHKSLSTTLESLKSEDPDSQHQAVIA